MRLAFAEFEIDLRRQELLQAGVAVHLEPQVFDLLVHLVRHRDRVISKDCRATIKVRRPDNQDERVVALLVSQGGRSPTGGASSATISLGSFEGCLVR